MKLVASNISKTFYATKALQDVTVELVSGQVKALVGENGAGKSTLLKIIASLYKPDSGSMTLDGKPYEPANLMDASSMGVTIVFQESTINPYLSISENIFPERLRNFKTRLGTINWTKLKKTSQKILDDINSDIDVNQNIWKLDLGQWKVIEIARALSYNPKVLLLDESTAFLNSKEAKAFLNVVERLKKQGMAIGFVSHHISEIFSISDTITVMKDGKFVSEHKTADVTADQIQGLMVGREFGSDIFPVRKILPKSEPILALENISIGSQLHDVNMTLNRGEILGIGGLKGSGGEAILQAIYGNLPFKKGRIELEGKQFHPKKPCNALNNKIAFVPGERTIEGLIVNFNLTDNLTMSNIPTKGLFINKVKELEISKEYIKELKIKAASTKVICSSLSGGNLQKVVIGKCLATHPRILLLNNPTRGIDVGSRYEIYNVISKLAQDGMSIILLSEDLLELLGMSDRILIMRKGQVSKTFDFGEKPTEEDVIGYMM